MKALALILFAAGLLIAASDSNAATDWRAYAKEQAAEQGWVGPQWRALDAVVAPESGWNPCARFPHTIECSYSGSNSCGIPQRNPCPQAWRGRLAETGRQQVAELLRYVRDRYGDPLAALTFRRGHGYY